MCVKRNSDTDYRVVNNKSIFIKMDRLQCEKKKREGSQRKNVIKLEGIKYLRRA